MERQKPVQQVVYSHRQRYFEYIAGSRVSIHCFFNDGDVTINQQPLNRRDGYGVWNTHQVRIKADSRAKLPLMEVPMGLG